MATDTNRFGLSRHIPEDIKREIRRAAGFGCVICGIGIASYEHIDPEFHEAKEHDPSRMAYLCEGCHSKVTRGMWSKEKVQRAREAPWCLRHGGPHDAFDVSGAHGIVWLGPNKIINVPTILQVAGEPLLKIEPPEAEGAPYRVSGKFYDTNGTLLFTIDRNEWIGDPAAWDIEVVGQRITIRRQHRDIVLQIRAVPPEGILVERADFVYRNARLKVDAERLSFTSDKGAGVVIEGRTIVGGGEGAVLLSVEEGGEMKMGPGPFEVLGVPDTLPRARALPRATVGRNDPCPCGSGRKYKRCHGR